MIQSLRGMNDIFSPENDKFTYFLDNALAIAKRYGYEYFESPILEETALFKRSVGNSSDIVGKEMYQFIDKGNNDVCLRPEGTAGVVRAFIQKKLDKAGGKHKFFYYGPMFRYERPQKGRLRQFHQFGCESFGEDSVYEDANIILMIKEILDFFNVDFNLELNSLGCPNCMPTYKKDLIHFIEAKEDLICNDCTRRLKINPIRVLDCKNETCQKEYSDAPKLLEQLCEQCHSDFIKLKSILDENQISYNINSHLVRGLDYYSKTAFEFLSSNLGAQNAIAGGGRYDKLVEFLDGKATPAIGFAIGIERFVDLIEIPEVEKNGYYFGAMIDEAIDIVFNLGIQKRKNEKTTIEYKKRSFKAHIKLANKVQARYCILIGEDELKNNTVWFKDLENKEEKNIEIEEFLSNKKDKLC
jgi:histidyl-tRNA synthetase